MSWERELQDLVRRRIGARVDIGAAAGSFGARLRRLVDDRVRRLELDGPEHYLACIREGGDEEARLISALTNPHSWFLRDEAALIHLLDALPADAPSALWCAGCAGGEEPYSLAMLGCERGMDLSIHATDIDASTVETARRGVYSEYPLRLVSPARRARFFEAVGSRPQAAGEQWRAGAALRERVTFHRKSLTDSALPCPAAGGWSAITCRNVLIYFDAKLAGAVYRRFARSLAPGAPLLTAASDPLPPPSLFRTKVDGSAVLHRADRASAQLLPIPLMAQPPAVPLKLPAPAPVTARPAAVPRFSIEPDSAFGDALEAGHLALLAADFEAALEAYGQATLCEPLRHEPYFFAGIAHRRASAPSNAIDSLRRALFIEPECWPAAFLLGGLFAEVREPLQSRRAYQHAVGQIEAGAALSEEIRAAPGISLDLSKVLALCHSALA